MTTIIAIFCLALFFALVLTPLVARVAAKYNVVDMPSDRKVHIAPIPRIGGVAIILAFFLPFLLPLFYSTKILDLLVLDRQTLAFIIGGLLVFGLGLWDDIKPLKPRIKFLIQTIAALIAYLGGIQIGGLSNPFGGALDLGWFSIPATVLWFLLIINAVNLTDGLDGLAAGVTFFVSLVLLVLCMTGDRFLVAMGFAALSGATLGFLRYNFNPASVFLGDCGSYFLGYMLAALCIMGSVKGQAAVAILIPIIALGVPILDTVWSPLRRFLLGRRMFSPDGEHLHHRLLKLGFSQRLAVLTIYGITIATGLIAIIMVHAKDERAALILVLLGAAIILGLRKLGYFEYFAMDKIFGWLKDVTDEVGITHERRSFLNLQLELSRSADVNEAWLNVCKALDRLKFDMAEMNIKDIGLMAQGSGQKEGQTEKREQEKWVWAREGFDSVNDVTGESLLKLELPLLAEENKTYGTLWLIKDLKRDSISHYTLRRVEHLRRTLIGTLQKLAAT